MSRRPRPARPTTLRLAARTALGLGLAVSAAVVVLPQVQPGQSPVRSAAVAGPAAAVPPPARDRERAVAAASRSRRAAPGPSAAAAGGTAGTSAVLRSVRSRIAHGTVRRQDPTRLRGRERVVRAGRDGVRVRTYRVSASGRTLVGDHVGRLAVPRVVAVGTRPRGTAAATRRQAPERSASRSAERRRASRDGASTTRDGLNWAALARCESGGDAGATNPSGKYRGLYQFDRRTWASVGGSGDPAAASAAEQTRRAQRLYQRSGRSPWPSCGRRL